MVGARSLVLACAIAAITAGCASRDYGFDRQPPRPAHEGAEKPPPRPDLGTLDARFQATWPRRDEPQALREAIAALRGTLEARGGADYGTLVLLSRAHYILGELEESKDAKLAAYEAGMHFGDRALDTIPAFHEAFARTNSLEEACEHVSIAGIDAIYWDAVNEGKWAHEKGIGKVFFVKDKVKRMVDRVLALDEKWWWGAAHRYLGAYFSALPGFGGRDRDASKAHFERAIATAPDMLSTRVLYAEYWARTANDRRAYVAQIDRVLATSPESIPALAAEQRLERKKAQRMRDTIDDHFDPEDAAASPSASAPTTGTATPGGKP